LRGLSGSGFDDQFWQTDAVSPAILWESPHPLSIVGVTTDALVDYLASQDYDPPIDGLHLLQQYVRAPIPMITRAEFVGGKFMYAVEVDTSDGFELCPADVCTVGDAFCPAGDELRPKFVIIDDIDADLKRRYEAFLVQNDIEVAGIEFIVDTAGTIYTYDVNTNTNYNLDAEVRAGRSGMATLARFLGAELSNLKASASQGARIKPLR
jgi:hypothetical protein